MRAAASGDRGWLHPPPSWQGYPPSLYADPAAIVVLADGVRVASGALVAILDALYFFDRPEVDLDGIKVVLSQLGPRLKQFWELSPDARVTSAEALYSAIVLALF